MTLNYLSDLYNHTGATHLTFGFTEESNFRWTEYDSSYEAKWRAMATTVDEDLQERKIRELVQYLHDQNLRMSVYSPLSLYAVNNEVNLIPWKSGYLLLKETSVTQNHWSVRGKNH